MGKTFEEKKKDILDKIFISKEEAEEIKDKKVEDEKEEIRLIRKENKELLSYIGNIENKIGSIMRDFEIKNPSTQSQKEYMNKFWDFIIKEVPIRFSSMNEENKYKLDEMKKVRKIEYYKDKLKELGVMKFTNLENQEVKDGN